MTNYDIQDLRDAAQRVENSYQYGRDPAVFRLLDALYRALPEAKPLSTRVRATNP